MVYITTLFKTNSFRWWTGRDLNPRLPRCERGDHTELIYRPVVFCLRELSLKDLELSVINSLQKRDFVIA